MPSPRGEGNNSPQNPRGGKGGGQGLGGCRVLNGRDNPGTMWARGGFIPGQGALTGNPGALPRPQWLRPALGRTGGSWRGKMQPGGFPVPPVGSGEGPQPRARPLGTAGLSLPLCREGKPKMHTSPLTWTLESGSHPHGSSPSPEHPAQDKPGFRRTV